MPWYTYKTSGKDLIHEASSNALFMAQPFSYNGIIYDYENDRKLTTKFSYDNSNNITKYIVSPTGSTYYTFYNANIKYAYIGFPRLIYCKDPTSLSILKEEATTVISGKYVYNNKTTSWGSNSLDSGGVTLPIKFSINNTNFKYLVISSQNKWNHYHSSNEKFISGYNKPYDIKTTNAPDDWTIYHITQGSNINLDFGVFPQEIPQFVYDWITKQFDKVYENIYTIKSVTGSTLATLTEAPPMTSATLSVVGNAKYLTLKGENDTNYTMEWTSETPQGKIFAGLATSKGGSIVIPVGETSTINLTESTDLYEVWQTYRPPTTTFEINLYKNFAESNKVDKTSELSTVGTISGILRQECSLINPEIIIQYDKPPDFNYCYIANFGRYYYVENIVSMRQNLWRVRLRCDVLMTYKTQILNLTARIARQQYIYSYRQIDSEIPFTNDPEITVEDIPNSLNLGTPGDDNILLTVVTDGT